ncbi:hypothetical protein BHF71_05445 [Vulcanibacillus modesticaldus]|uniref:YbbR-like domain-containing protein YbbR n=1 Tax=Vulcanibacillus modesticaldus TaxID=337097 RepID=A0A1D2YX80_9BACI|nr:CdaR family protein [Vulcanibacillus modesticaldus]OEG00233.1 hypothetical protein BHF71_05445 [Vulcanibacillus modesticaldus]
MDNWIKNNNFLKILSLILAIMLWMVVNLDTNSSFNNNFSKNSQTTYFYQTKISPIFDENQFVVDMQTDEVKVILRGEASVIDKLHDSNNIDKARFFIDLANLSVGTYEVPIKYSGFPSSIDVEIEPQKVEVRLESKYRKEIEVTIDKIGKEKEGFQSAEPIIRPKKVHISGTKDLVEKVAFVKAFINIDKAEKSISEQVPLRAFDKYGNVVQVDITPLIVDVQIPITSPFVTIPLTFKIDKQPPNGWALESLNLLTKEVTIYGPKEIISQYNVYTGPNVDLSNLEGNQTVKVNIPLEEKLLKVEPDYIEFEAKVVESITKTIKEVPIEIIGLGRELSARITNPSNGVDIIVEGAPKIMEALAKEDVQAFVDVSNLPPGEYQILIQYNTPILVKQIDKDKFANVVIIKE